MQLQEVPLDLALGRVVRCQGHVGRDEVQVDGAGLQPDGAAQQRGLGRAQRRPLGPRRRRALHPAGLAVLLLDVLPDVDVLHHGADALAHRLVVQVAVGHADGGRLRGGQTSKRTLSRTFKVHIPV